MIRVVLTVLLAAAAVAPSWAATRCVGSEHFSAVS